jgi:phage replication-related protein YjqB (UPF0714/DUF867 family)
MKFINVILSASTVFALTDYFEYVKDMHPQLKISKDEDTEINEVRLPIYPSQITNKDGIQVLSLAVHGGQVENNTEKLAYKLYEEAIKTKKKSMLYSFISNIDTIRSGSVQSDRCTTIHCCKKIKDKAGVSSVNPYFGNGSNCESFGKESVEECNSEKVCYLNAAHVTSENFMTNKLNEILKDRYPVSFHGYKDRNADDGKLVHIVLGGPSNQKFDLAEEFYKASSKAFRIAVCKTTKNCKVYDPSIDFEHRIQVDGSHITELSTKNFVNKGKKNCGIQIELSATFRNATRTSENNWNTFIQSIVKTLPRSDKEIC